MAEVAGGFWYEVGFSEIGEDGYAVSGGRYLEGEGDRGGREGVPGTE